MFLRCNLIVKLNYSGRKKRLSWKLGARRFLCLVGSLTFAGRLQSIKFVSRQLSPEIIDGNRTNCIQRRLLILTPPFPLKSVHNVSIFLFTCRRCMYLPSLFKKQMPVDIRWVHESTKSLPRHCVVERTDARFSPWIGAVVIELLFDGPNLEIIDAHMTLFPFCWDHNF